MDKFIEGYKEPIDDDELFTMIQAGITNSSGDFLNSADLARERQKSTMEYGMLPVGHLQPQGVSQIVSSDSVEAVEGYLAILSELMLNNNKLARFIPAGGTPMDVHKAKVASDLTNYVIFKQNNGWEICTSWLKAALMWKNSVVNWEYIDDYEYNFEEFEEIAQDNLDIYLANPDVEVVGALNYEPLMIPQEDGSQTYVNIYTDVRLRTRKSKNRVKIKHISPEAFRISRDATSVQDADFVGIQTDVTRSELRKMFPRETEGIEWDDIGEGSTRWANKYIEEKAARKQLVGEEYWAGSTGKNIYETEANRNVTITECWIRVDRDGDGIAELKRFIVAGKVVILEEDACYVPLAVLCPFEVPHEFHGLSVTDIIRPSTLASTAILRGFVENVYLTNYSPKLADPNVVDFSSLQNMKPKQLIPTNGNPNNAVAQLTPDTISQGTVPLLEMLQMHKEQATGLGKAAQGLNDKLYVSGNSEEKMQRAMSAAQVRIQFMARRFAETGFKQLAEGVYRTIRAKMQGQKLEYYDNNDFLKTIDPSELPDCMLMYVDADVGENSNSNIIKKMSIIGKDVIPALQQAGAGGAVKPSAATFMASKIIDSLDLDPLDFLVDFNDPEFIKKAEEGREAEVQANEKMKQLEEKIKNLDIMQRESTIALTNIQSKNAIQDNARQMLVAIDKHHQEWADIVIKAAKEGVDPPPKPDIMEMIRMSMAAITMDASAPLNAPQVTNGPGPAAELLPTTTLQ